MVFFFFFFLKSLFVTNYICLSFTKNITNIIKILIFFNFENFVSNKLCLSFTKNIKNKIKNLIFFNNINNKIFLKTNLFKNITEIMKNLTQKILCILLLVIIYCSIVQYIYLIFSLSSTKNLFYEKTIQKIPYNIYLYSVID